MRVESLQPAKSLHPSLRDFHFQYPPCGSSRCNLIHELVPVIHCRSFSTLHAGRVAATLPELAEVECFPINFQYPPCGSSRCNRLSVRASSSCRCLSVPSMRVESLQQRVADWTT